MITVNLGLDRVILRDITEAVVADVLRRHSEPIEVRTILGALNPEQVVVVLADRLDDLHVVQIVAELGRHCRRPREQQGLLTTRIFREGLLEL